MQTLAERLDVGRLLTSLVGFVPNLVVALAILGGFWVAYRLTRAPLKALLQRAGLHVTLVSSLVDKIYGFCLLVLGAVMAADQVGIHVGTALAGIGVVGVALGFAAQETLANLIAGFLIFLDKPFLVEDWVSVGGQYGQVFEITLRTTRIRTRDNTYVVIPNKTIIDEILVNHSKHGSTRVNVPVGIAYKESIPHARDVVLAALSGIPGILPSPAPSVDVVGLGDSSVDLEIRAWVADAGLERPTFHQVLEASKLALDAAGIEIPFPHLQLFVDSVEERVWERVRDLAGGGSGAVGAS
jgi:small conductance mechanosensitive channel